MNLCVIVFASIALLPRLAPAQDAKPGVKSIQQAETQKTAETKAKDLSLTPAPAPVPALKYRLLPRESDRRPGDAAPIYLRIGNSMPDEMRKAIGDKHAAWINLPLDEFPAAEARKFINDYRSKTDQIEFGAWRQTCRWDYSLPEQKEHSIGILLPDAQEMRNWAWLLSIKVKTEIAERKYDDAARTMTTGFSFARHVGEGPFVINTLVGIAIANVMLAELEEMIARPDAPNMYWGLTVLPRPLVGVRNSLETEQKVPEYLVPEIADVNAPRTEAEWSSLLIRLHRRLNGLPEMLRGHDYPKPVFPKSTGLDQFKTEQLPEARQHFKGRGDVGALSDDHAIVLYLADRFHAFQDDGFMAQYVTYPESGPLIDEAQKRAQAQKSGPLAIFIELFPAVDSVLTAEVKLDRRVAALRVVEAIRLHAHANGGKLPESLDRIKIVPVPPDPANGKPFPYHLDGDTAVLKSDDARPGTSRQLPPHGIFYKITMRK